VGVATNYVDLRVMPREVLDLGDRPVLDQTPASAERMADVIRKLGNFRQPALAIAIHNCPPICSAVDLQPDLRDIAVHPRNQSNRRRHHEDVQN
jgi:hypothetical protein